MEGKDNAVTGPLLAVVLVALGVIAIVVRAGKFVSDRDFFNAVGILVLIGGIYLIYKGARTDGPRDMIFGGCMLAVMGFVLYVTDGPGFLIFWLAVIVVAELGLKLFFMMPLPVINVNFGSVAAEKAAGVGLVAAAVVLALLEDYVWDWFMYLFGLVLISVGALYLAQSRSGSEGKAVGKR